MIEHPDVKANFHTIVDHFEFSARSSDIIKVEGPHYLFRELEDRRLVDIQKGSISELRPLIEIIGNENCFAKSEFFSLLEDRGNTEGKDGKHKAMEVTDFAYEHRRIPKSGKHGSI